MDALAAATGAVDSVEARRRLSAPAVRAFSALAGQWKLSEREQLALLGDSVGRSTLYEWAKGMVRGTLNQDQLMRVSYLLGIYEGLQRLWHHAPAEADAWVRRHVADHPFHGRPPLAFMIHGGLPAMAETRAYIDGATGGPPSRG
ncbi:MAG TPA: hypothetical protein VFS44_14155 [Gemmatimonadaceae bacterium]|nr:hypothetical protein [Gemmatimonadaceae bacterium]